MKIEIKTHLHEGIYKSSGGGQTRTIYSLKAGPRNLIRALALIEEHRAAMVQGYGNIGCGKTWMEINGQEVEDRWISSDMEAWALESTGKTRTAVAREWLDAYRSADE